MDTAKRINILVLGVGGTVSQGIVKAIRRSGLDVNLTGACISPNSVGLYLCDRAYVSPYAREERFIPWLIDLCNQENIDLILTGVEENIAAIQPHVDQIREKTKAIFIASGVEKLTIGGDKYLTCRWLEENGCNFPKYTLASECSEEFLREAGFPLVAKPRQGKGSSGVFLIRSREELSRLDSIADLSSYVLEECIGTPETEYTVGCYCNKQGKLTDTIIMHRDLQQGSTAAAEVVFHDAIRAEAQKICAAFRPAGPLNIQLRLDKDGRPVCFELNVRFSGTTPMRSVFGFRDVEAMIREYILGEDISSCFQVRTGRAYRYTQELYLAEEPVLAPDGHLQWQTLEH